MSAKPNRFHQVTTVNEPATNILTAGPLRDAISAELDALDFLGSVTCSHEELIAGSLEEVVIDYVVGSSGIADSGGIKLCFKYYSDWDFQSEDLLGKDYCTVEYKTGSLVGGASVEGAATLQHLKWRYDHKGGERPFQKAIVVDLVDGYLRPGDHIVFHLGDKRAGGPGSRVQTFVEHGFRFRVMVDPLGTQRYARGPELSLEVVAGPPSSLVVTSPRLARRGEPVAVGVHLEDIWGNPIEFYSSQVELEVSGSLHQSITLDFPESGWASASVSLQLDSPGETCLKASLLGPSYKLKSAPAYLEVVEGLDARAWFGDLHIHTNDTVGTNDNEYNFSYARDIARLDFMGYTANDFQITDARWEQVVQLADKFTQEGSFICFPGVEWCGTPGVGGDHNVVFIGSDTTLARCVEWHEEMGKDHPEPGAWPIGRLYQAYEDHPEDYLLIPHVGGRRAILDWHHPELERLIEVHSAWGPDPWFFEEAMRRGLRLGASGASDEHRGRPGGGHPGANIFGSRGGLCGVLSDKLDRGSIGTSLRSRHTWASTGGRLVALLFSGKTRQGDEIKASEPVEINYLLLGDTGWEEISAYDGAGLLWERALDAEVGYSPDTVRLRWGGAQVKDRYRWMDWTGTFSVSGSAIDSVEPWAFQHGEHRLWTNPSDGNIHFSGRTYGDSQGALVSLRNLRRSNFTIDAVIGPEYDLHWETSGLELIESGGVLRQEVGGVDLFISLERLAEKELPRRVEGTFVVEGKDGQACVYIRGRQRDGQEVWTSPIFIDFS